MYNNFVVEGEKIVLELLRDSNIEIENIICTSDWADQYPVDLANFKDQILLANPKDIQQISSLKTSGKVLAVAKQIEMESATGQLKDGLFLYLDRIQNPGNFGTIVRIADWFGISKVYCSFDSADLYNPKVIQSTMGAFLRVKIIKANFEDLKADYPQYPIYGTLLEGENLFAKSLTSEGIIVIGSEGKGISENIRQLITDPIAIPAHPDGGAESLNAAVAAGIVCAAFRNND